MTNRSRTYKNVFDPSFQKKVEAIRRIPLPEGCIATYRELRDYVNANLVPVDPRIVVRDQIKTGSFWLSNERRLKLPRQWTKLYVGATRIHTATFPAAVCYIPHLRDWETPSRIFTAVASLEEDHAVVLARKSTEDIGLVASRRVIIPRFFTNPEDALRVFHYPV